MSGSIYLLLIESCFGCVDVASEIDNTREHECLFSTLTQVHAEFGSRLGAGSALPPSIILMGAVCRRAYGCKQLIT